MFVPVPNPIIRELGEEGEMITPNPLTNVHKPVPDVGVFPASVAELLQIV